MGKELGMEYMPELINMTEDAVASPAVVMYREQLKSIESKNSVCIAKPWYTSYRGRLFVYVPQRTKRIDIQGINTQPGIPNGIYATTNLKKILPVSDVEWERLYSSHKEMGKRPFEKTFLWYFDSTHLFSHVIRAKLISYWSNSDEIEQRDNFGDLITPHELRVLHKLKLVFLGQPYLNPTRL